LTRQADVPKILVISNWAPPMVGGPRNLYNLLSQFPQDAYIVLTAAHPIDALSAATDAWLPGRYVFFDKRGEVAVRRGGHAAADRTKPSLRTKLSHAISRIPGLGKPLLDALYLANHLPGVVRSARTILREHQIESVLGISDEGLALLGTYLVHRLSGLPYSLYLFDLYLGNNLTIFTRALARILEPRLVREARSVIVTNGETASYLRKRYGASCRLEIVPNSAFPEDFAALAAAPPAEAPYRIVFTGNVYWAQEGAVLNMIRAMDLLRDLPVELDLYCPQVTEAVRLAVAARANIRMTSAPQSGMPRIQSEASLLFLPLAWGTRAPDIVATASPGKFTDYLASGRPILVHAPEYSYVARYARKHGLAVVVDRDDVRALADAIRRFFEDPACGNRYVAKALQVFRANHDARENAKKLWGIIGERAMNADFTRPAARGTRERKEPEKSS